MLLPIWDTKNVVSLLENKKLDHQKRGEFVMDFISVMILTMVNIFVCVALPKILSAIPAKKPKPTLIPVVVKNAENYQIHNPEFALSNENA